MTWIRLYSEKCMRPKYPSPSPPESVQVQVHSQLLSESESKYYNSFSNLMSNLRLPDFFGIRWKTSGSCLQCSYFLKNVILTTL